MKLTLLSTTLAATLILACVNTQAQTNAPVATSTPGTTAAAASTPVASTKKAGLTNYKGTITAIDTTANTVTLNCAKGPKTLTITADTKYRGGKSLADFAVGDVVTGSFVTDATGAMTAHSLHKKKAK
jgi:hypothetical protein